MPARDISLEILELPLASKDGNDELYTLFVGDIPDERPRPTVGVVGDIFFNSKKIQLFGKVNDGWRKWLGPNKMGETHYVFHPQDDTRVLWSNVKDSGWVSRQMIEKRKGKTYDHHKTLQNFVADVKRKSKQRPHGSRKITYSPDVPPLTPSYSLLMPPPPAFLSPVPTSISEPSLTIPPMMSSPAFAAPLQSPSTPAPTPTRSSFPSIDLRALPPSTKKSKRTQRSPSQSLVGSSRTPLRLNVEASLRKSPLRTTSLPLPTSLFGSPIPKERVSTEDEQPMSAVDSSSTITSIIGSPNGEAKDEPMSSVDPSSAVIIGSPVLPVSRQGKEPVRFPPSPGPTPNTSRKGKEQMRNSPAHSQDLKGKGKAPAVGLILDGDETADGSPMAVDVEDSDGDLAYPSSADNITPEPGNIEIHAGPPPSPPPMNAPSPEPHIMPVFSMSEPETPGSPAPEHLTHTDEFPTLPPLGSALPTTPVQSTSPVWEVLLTTEQQEVFYYLLEKLESSFYTNMYCQFLTEHQSDHYVCIVCIAAERLEPDVVVVEEREHEKSILLFEFLIRHLNFQKTFRTITVQSLRDYAQILDVVSDSESEFLR